MAAGLRRQLERCEGQAEERPAFCGDEGVRGNVRGAYNHLWYVFSNCESVWVDGADY